MKTQTLLLTAFLSTFLFYNSLHAQWKGTTILTPSDKRNLVLIGSTNRDHTTGIGRGKLTVVGDFVIKNGAIHRGYDTTGTTTNTNNLELYGADAAGSIPTSTSVQSGRMYNGGNVSSNPFTKSSAPLTAAWNVVGVGTDIDFDKLRTNGYKFAVKGKMIAEEVVVKLYANWPDFVFAKDHRLTPLNELEQFIKANQHLPGIPSQAEMKAKDGINVSEILTAQMQKIEELTLYLIEQDKQIKELQLLVKEQNRKK